MDTRTREALEASIVKWEANSKIRRIDDATTGPGDCPLCQIYHSRLTGVLPTCVGCPVYEKTGRPYCEDTPYERYEEADDRLTIKEFKSISRDMLDFLRSLLPAEQEA